MHVPTRTLILFDVDGVLVHPVGYKAALRATLDRFAAQMGQPASDLSYDEIAVFEACGITNEWDSGAICVSMILRAALEQRPDLRRATLDETFAAICTAGLQLPRPDFVAAAREVEQHTTADGPMPAAVYLTLIAGRTDPANVPLLRILLGDVYDVFGAPATLTFQTHTLGHQRFAATYGHSAPFESQSYLTEYDTALLDAHSREQLLAFCQPPNHGAAVFTARPSLFPADLPDGESPGHPPAGYAPEAELAADLLGLTGRIPLIGQGRISWLAWRHGRGVGEYLKPSPVQALASIGAAISGLESQALESAAAFFERGDLTGPLAALDSRPTRVIVFEDSPGGIRAGRRAVEQLQRAGLAVSFEAIGVSPQADKREALSAVTDRVVDDVNTGLALIWKAA